MITIKQQLLTLSSVCLLTFTSGCAGGEMAFNDFFGGDSPTAAEEGSPNIPTTTPPSIDGENGTVVTEPASSAPRTGGSFYNPPARETNSNGTIQPPAPPSAPTTKQSLYDYLPDSTMIVYSGSRAGFTDVATEVGLPEGGALFLGNYSDKMPNDVEEIVIAMAFRNQAVAGGDARSFTSDEPGTSNQRSTGTTSPTPTKFLTNNNTMYQIVIYRGVEAISDEKINEYIHTIGDQSWTVTPGHGDEDLVAVGLSEHLKLLAYRPMSDIVVLVLGAPVRVDQYSSDRQLDETIRNQLTQLTGSVNYYERYIERDVGCRAIQDYLNGERRVSGSGHLGVTVSRDGENVLVNVLGWQSVNKVLDVKHVFDRKNSFSLWDTIHDGYLKCDEETEMRSGDSSDSGGGSGGGVQSPNAFSGSIKDDDLQPLGHDFRITSETSCVAKLSVVLTRGSIGNVVNPSLVFRTNSKPDAAHAHQVALEVSPSVANGYEACLPTSLFCRDLINQFNQFGPYDVQMNYRTNDPTDCNRADCVDRLDTLPTYTCTADLLQAN